MDDKKNEQKGVWRTVCGRRIFIAEGQTLSEAMKASGKFSDDETAKAGEFEKPQDVTPDAADVLGDEFKGLKGQEAVKKVMQERKGHVKDAFTREDIGGITFMWGDDGSGMQHIEKDRAKQGITDMDEFMSDITDVVETGEAVKINDNGRIEILKNGKMAIIAPVLRDGRITYLFTAYKTRKKNKPPNDDD